MDDLILVRSTVNLAGFPVGELRLVDPSRPVIKDLLDGKILIADKTADPPEPDAPASEGPIVPVVEGPERNEAASEPVESRSDEDGGAETETDSA